VFVKPLEPEQAQRPVKITRTSRDRVRLRRAGVVLASVQGRSASEIAQMFAASEGYVREVIHAFNETEFAALDPKRSGGWGVSSVRPSQRPVQAVPELTTRHSPAGNGRI
jgi:hypothetical protein